MAIKFVSIGLFILTERGQGVIAFNALGYHEDVAFCSSGHEHFDWNSRQNHSQLVLMEANLDLFAVRKHLQ